MPYVKVDRDTILDKIYVLRSQIDFDNKPALKTIEELVTLITQMPILESQAVYPRIRTSR